MTQPDTSFVGQRVGMRRFQIMTDDLQVILHPGFSRAQWALFLLLLAVFAVSALGVGIDHGIRAVPAAVGRL